MNFISRLRRSDQIIGGSAIALFIFMFFFKWLGFSSNTPLGGGSVSSNGWNSFHNSRWIWVITIIVALGSVAISAGMLKLESPVQPGVLVAGLGALSTALILYRILKHPSGGSSGTIAGVHYGYSYGIKIGIWLGLIAAAGITYGGYLGMQAEGTSLADVREQASGAISNLSGSSGGSQAGGSGGGSGASASTPTPPPASSPMPPPVAPPIPPPAAPPSPESPGDTPPAY
jgi:hypothetical protein